MDVDEAALLHVALRPHLVTTVLHGALQVEQFVRQELGGVDVEFTDSRANRRWGLSGAGRWDR